MKRINCILVFLTITFVMGFSQNRYGETLPLQTMCACEMANHFRNRPNDTPFRPFNMPTNYPCGMANYFNRHQSVLAATNLPQSSYLFGHWHPFAKWKKKRAIASYSKKSKSNIVRF